VALVLQVILVGVAAGGVYGIAAIGYATLYRLTGVIHFALGELVSLAVFTTLFIVGGTGPVSRTGVNTGRFLLALVAGIVLSLLAGGVVYVIGVRPFLRRGSLLGWIGGLLTVTFAIRGFLAASFDRPGYVFPDPIRFDRLSNGGVIRLGGGVTLQERTFFVIGVGVALALVATWWLRSTRRGQALRAIADSREAATVIGLPVDGLVSIAFAAAGALAFVAAVAQAPSASVSPETGTLLGLKGLVAAVLAGFGSPFAAFVAGLGVGVLEAAVSAFHLGALRLGPAYRDVLPLAVALVVLAVRTRSTGLAEYA
jgi:branched-chain amino acid transport system permease protein